MSRKIKREISSLSDFIWHKSFNLDYWYRRLEKIDLDDSEDRDEAFYLLLQLTDLYAHVLAAQLDSPKDIWQTLKNDTYTSDIREKFAEYEDGDSEYRYNIEKHGSKDVLATMELPEELKQGLEDYQKAAMGLGCSVDLDKEGTSISFDESPQKYVNIVNFFMGLWKRTYDRDELYKDYKHGFRHPFFNSKTMDYLEQITPGIQDEEGVWEDLRDKVESDNVYFFQLEEADEEKHRLRVFEAQPEVSLKLAEVVFQLINNLFINDQNLEVVEDFESVLEDGEMPDIYRVPLRADIVLDEEVPNW